MRLAWVAMACLIPAISTYEFEFTVEGGKKVCFIDYLTDNSHLIFGFTPIEVNNDDEIYQALAPLGSYSKQSQDDTPNHDRNNPTRRVLLPTSSISNHHNHIVSKSSDNDGDKIYRKSFESKPGDTDQAAKEKATQGESVTHNLLASERFKETTSHKIREKSRILQTKKKTKQNAGGSEEGVDPMGAFYNEKSETGSKVFKGMGTIVITNSEGTIISPSTVRPYGLYKISFDKPINTIEVCYESFVESRTLVRLNYRYREKNLVVDLPSKTDSSGITEQLLAIENRLEETLKNYEELRRYESRFISTSEETLSRFMSIGQILLFCYLVVTWLIKLFVERSFRLKKII